MRKLAKEIKAAKQTFTQVDRTAKAAIYQSNQGHYEVFLIKTKKAGVIFGKEYPDREVYPKNEAFGASAWCYMKMDDAMKRFEKLNA